MAASTIFSKTVKFVANFQSWLSVFPCVCVVVYAELFNGQYYLRQQIKNHLQQAEGLLLSAVNLRDSQN